MKDKITLLPMTPEMYHRFFKEYQNDSDLYLDKSKFCEYSYSKEKVDAYIQRQIDLKRVTFAIMLGEEIVGELKIYNIVNGESAYFGITVKNKSYKDKGIGTRAEELALDYVFNVLNIPILYADSILTNTRSQHVLEKVGFEFIYQDEERKYYKAVKKNFKV